MGSSRGLKKIANFDTYRDMRVFFMEHNFFHPEEVSRIERRKGRESRKLLFQRMIGKIVLLSVCLGGTIAISANAAFAYVPNNGIKTHTRTIRRRNLAYTATVVSSSKIAPERINQKNATNNNSGTDESSEKILQQNLSYMENTFSSDENFFHESRKSDVIPGKRVDDMYNLEKLLIDGGDIDNAVFYSEAISMDPESGRQNRSVWFESANRSIQEGSCSVKPDLNNTQQIRSEFPSEGDGFDAQENHRCNYRRRSIFRRIRPLRSIRRIFGRSSQQENRTTTLKNDGTDDFDGIDIGMNLPVQYNMNISDNALYPRKPSLRQLWRKRHARTLEEGIRRERRNTLSFLMNKAIVNARPSQERSYIERSLMGLINGLAEEVEDLDIELNTVSKTPFWRKEVEEIRINFSRLGFRPIQMGGTNSVIEIVSSENDEGDESSGSISDGMNALATSPSSSEQRRGGGVNSGASELSFVECADEGFDSIDEDGSGTLDRDELAQALNSISGLKTNKDSIEELASDLVRLYDDNGDGVVDREEYQQMVEDMAKLRAVKENERKSGQKNPLVAVKDSLQSVSEGISSKAGEVVSAARDRYFSEKSEEKEIETEMGSIVLSKVNLDLRRLVFGALPVMKKITPGGPLILEPFTATVTASFSREDVMGSFLLDAALKRLVARILRVRVRSYRDLVEGALFVGRRWKLTCKTAPVVEVLELSNVEFDSRDKMIITGRARIRADPDAPIVTSTFKVRTKIGTRKNGQVIKVKEPELAFVFECPKALENGLATACKTLGLPAPKRPEPYYSFFPIYSPFKVDDDTGGFDMGEDNCIRSIFIRNGKLRFEMSVVLRPGRFLGNHYLAFTVPQRTFIITMDRVWNGVRAARENKQKADRARKQKEAEKALEVKKATKSDDSSNEFLVSPSESESTTNAISKAPFDSKSKIQATQWRLFKTIKENTPKPKSFYTRFVEGYTMIEREEEASNERITNDISDWFGRQGLAEDATSQAMENLEKEEEKPE